MCGTPPCDRNQAPLARRQSQTTSEIDEYGRCATVTRLDRPSHVSAYVKSAGGAPFGLRAAFHSLALVE